MIVIYISLVYVSSLFYGKGKWNRQGKGREGNNKEIMPYLFRRKGKGERKKWHFPSKSFHMKWFGF